MSIAARIRLPASSLRTLWVMPRAAPSWASSGFAWTRSLYVAGTAQAKWGSIGEGGTVKRISVARTCLQSMQVGQGHGLSGTTCTLPRQCGPLNFSASAGARRTLHTSPEKELLPAKLLKVEAALAMGDDKILKKLMEKMSGDEQILLVKDLYSKQITADGFERMDANRDGMVSEAEFEAFVKNLNINQKQPPTTRQLMLVMIASGVPFVGFGMCDNSIMIIAGESIELYMGMVFTISTMCAAALGNLVSDVLGIGLAGYIGMLSKKLGVKDPLLTPNQLNMRVVRLASSGGAAIGVTIGCVIGMFPLLFFKNHDDDDDDKDDGAKK